MPTGNTVKTDQQVNPEILDKIDSYVNNCGAGIMHEITESYEGAKISKQSGISALPAKRGVNNTIYKQAHEKAAKQPAENQTFMKNSSNGTIIYLGTEDRVDVILQTIK